MSIAEIENVEEPTGSLADEEAEELPGVDMTALPQPEDFDPAEFIAGVKNARRGDTLYQRNDIRADVDILDEKIELMRKAGEDTTEQEDLREQVAQMLLGTGRPWVVEARNSDWDKDFNRRMKKAGINPWSRKFDALTNAKMLSKMTEAQKEALLDEHSDLIDQVLNHRVAEQIVHPKGVTAEMVAQLRVNNEQEWQKLVEIVKAVNNQPGVTRDFSSRFSKPNRTG